MSIKMPEFAKSKEGPGCFLKKIIRISFIDKTIGYWFKNLFYQKQECESDIIIKFVFGIWDFPLFLKQEK